MDYGAAYERGDGLVIAGARHFVPGEVLDNGQAFRFAQESPFCFSGIAHGRRLEIRAEGSDIVLKGVSLAEFGAVWREYFDLGRDYGALRAFLLDECSGFPIMRMAIEHSPGLRMMKQDPWEALVSFILSQNANIPRIKGMVARLCERFGERLPCGGHAFPPAARLAALSSAEEMAFVKCGYRAGYILDAARAGPDFGRLGRMETAGLRAELMKIRGVGPKVADCALLMGFGRTEACPQDVWMKRVMARHFPGGFPESVLPYAGIAQQFLFQFVRSPAGIGALANSPPSC